MVSFIVLSISIGILIGLVYFHTRVCCFPPKAKLICDIWEWTMAGDQDSRSCQERVYSHMD